VPVDAERNPVGKQYDLGIDDAFNCFKVLYCHLLQGPDAPILQDWVADLGFDVTVVRTLADCTAQIPNFAKQ